MFCVWFVFGGQLTTCTQAGGANLAHFSLATTGAHIVWTWGAPMSGSDCLLRRVLSSFNAKFYLRRSKQPQHRPNQNKITCLATMSAAASESVESLPHVPVAPACHDPSTLSNVQHVRTTALHIALTVDFATERLSGTASLTMEARVPARRACGELSTRTGLVCWRAIPRWSRPLVRARSSS